MTATIDQQETKPAQARHSLPRVGLAWLQLFWRPETGVFLAVWLVLMVGGRNKFIHDPGTFWHTVVGEQMLSSGRLIETDTFTFTFSGQTWLAHQWLGECLMALVHRWGGLDSLLLVTVTLLAALYTGILHRLTRGGLHWSLALVVVSLVIGASSAHFHIRPHIGTILCLACSYALLCDFEAGRIGLGHLAWLVPLFVLWTNLHGGMLGGFGTVVLAVAGWSVAKLLGQASPKVRACVNTPIVRYRQLVPLALILLGCGLAAFVNPYGWRLPWTWLRIMHADLPTLFVEHAPLQFTRPEGLMVLLFGLVYLAALLSTLPCRLRVTWLLPLVWFYLACTRVRHAPLFSVTAALALADLVPHTRWASWLAGRGSDWFRPPDVPRARGRRIVWPVLPAAALVLIALLLQGMQVPFPVLGKGWAEMDAAYWPVELLPELKQNEPAPASPRRPIFNEDLYGGFLIYYAPGYQVFVDDRCELFGDRWLEDYVRAEWQDTAGHVRRWERQYGPFDLALIRTDSGYDQYFSSAADWVRVKRTATATLYRMTR